MGFLDVQRGISLLIPKLILEGALRLQRKAQQSLLPLGGVSSSPALAGASLGALHFTPIYMAALLYGGLCHYINIVNCYKTRQNHWKMS